MNILKNLLILELDYMERKYLKKTHETATKIQACVRGYQACKNKKKKKKKMKKNKVPNYLKPTKSFLQKIKRGKRQINKSI